MGIDPKFFDKNQVHLHIPAGAIPKDGPSAGVTMSTALVSLMTDAPVRNDVCMTGEISLSGRVLPVGGIKEKVLAALNQGIYDVILPIANKKDVSDVPEEFRKNLNFIFVEHIDEVLSIALQKTGPASKRTGGRGSRKTKYPRVASGAA